MLFLLEHFRRQLAYRHDHVAKNQLRTGSIDYSSVFTVSPISFSSHIFSLVKKNIIPGFIILQAQAF